MADEQTTPEFNSMDCMERAYATVVFGGFAFRFGPYEPKQVGPVLERLAAELGDHGTRGVSILLEGQPPVEHLEAHLRELLTGDIADQPGTCRVCSCTEDNACMPPCGWYDSTQTLCDNPECLKVAGLSDDAPEAEAVSG